MAALRILLAAIVLALPMLLWATPAHACSCVPRTFEEKVNLADLIVIGTAQERRLIDPPSMPTPLSSPNDVDSVTPSGPAEVLIAVEEYIKGSGPDILFVRESIPFSTCSAFGTGLPGRYILFLTRLEDGFHQASFCESSHLGPGTEAFLIDQIEQIRQVLEGPISAPPLGTGSAESSASYLPVVSTASAGMLLVAAGLFLRRRSNARDES